MSAQLSKAVERLLGTLWIPHVSKSLSMGENQFAYRKERGARGALALLMLTWLDAFRRRKRVGVYCSDVSGAFDRVDCKRMEQKLKARRIPDPMTRILSSWLSKRQAQVVVEGASSECMDLMNMLYQDYFFLSFLIKLK